jgi:carbonic anhydrase
MKTIIILCFAALTISCKHGSEKHTNTKNHATKHWSYQGETSPEHWVEIEKNSDCNGNHQSPINIIDINTVAANSRNHLDIFYSPKTVLNSVENNGHTIKFNFEKGDSIQYNGTIYYLKQIHFHEHSEHTVNGLIYPIETHLVHVSKKNDITVLGILGQEGNESQLFEFFESFLPLEMNEVKTINHEQDLNKLFPENKDFYSYSGSLTTPPCSENVNWIVFKNPIILSVEEVSKLKQYMPLNNFRNEQALNARVVYSNIVKE